MVTILGMATIPWMIRILGRYGDCHLDCLRDDIPISDGVGHRNGDPPPDSGYARVGGFPRDDDCPTDDDPPRYDIRVRDGNHSKKVTIIGI